MFNIDEFETKRIIEIIESVDETLKYSSMDLFKRAMESVGFVIRQLKNYPNFSYYSCKGKIEGNLVHLDIYQKTRNDVVCVSGKSYYREALVGKRVKRIAHRDNDLPSIINYDEDHGKVTSLRYFLNNSEFRETGKPVCVTYKYNQSHEILSTHCRFNCEVHLNNFINFSLYEVTHVNNLIIDCLVCYNDGMLSLQELKIIIPDISVTTLEDLFNLKHVITDAHLKLIDMFII